MSSRREIARVKLGFDLPANLIPYQDLPDRQGRFFIHLREGSIKPSNGVYPKGTFALVERQRDQKHEVTVTPIAACFPEGEYLEAVNIYSLAILAGAVAYVKRGFYGRIGQDLRPSEDEPEYPYGQDLWLGHEFYRIVSNDPITAGDVVEVDDLASFDRLVVLKKMPSLGKENFYHTFKDFLFEAIKWHPRINPEQNKLKFITCLLDGVGIVDQKEDGRVHEHRTIRSGEREAPIVIFSGEGNGKAPILPGSVVAIFENGRNKYLVKLYDGEAEYIIHDLKEIPRLFQSELYFKPTTAATP